MEDYLKAVDLLSINNTKIKLEKEVEELSEKSKNNEYIIQGKLAEKENEIQDIRKEISIMKEGQRELFELMNPAKKLLELLEDDRQIGTFDE